MKKFPRPKIVVSRCIEFDACRYNGSIVSSPFVNNLKNFAEIIPICPEVEIGLGIPRDAVRLVKRDQKILLLNSITGEDHTKEMDLFKDNFLSSLKHINGFILKSRSPSCGITGVKLYNKVGKVQAINTKSKGIFGKAVIEKFGYAAIEDEGRLTNLQIREHFLTKLYTLANFEILQPRMNDLVKFHSRNKYLFMAYNQKNLKLAGKIVANHPKNKIEQIFYDYRQILHKILYTRPRISSNINVVMHIFGYFSKNLSLKEKAYFLDQLEIYRNKKTPLIVLTSILKAWSLRFEMDYLLQQTYFEPFPGELLDISNSGKSRTIV